MKMIAREAFNRNSHILYRMLQNRVHLNNLRAYISSDNVSIGGVSKVIKRVNRPEYVPQNYYNDTVSQSTMHHLRWMMQKDELGQDIFLLGPPGPRRRSLAMQYLELTNREHEYVALSRDTTESDLKQRREIVAGTATYFDQSAVRAATHGRILILEGIEKAERNVLPVLNNLLENREMHLEDGRLLIPAERYDQLLQSHTKEDLDRWKLVRVNEDFRVIALGLPVPRYRGNPLDPPLRSRFQARDVNISNYQEHLADFRLNRKDKSAVADHIFDSGHTIEIGSLKLLKWVLNYSELNAYEWATELKLVAPNASKEKIDQLLSIAYALLSKESANLGVPDFPVDNLTLGAKLLERFPHLSAFNIFYRIYPYKSFLKEGLQSIEDLLSNFKMSPPEQSITHNIVGNSSNLFEKPNVPFNANVKSGYIRTNYQDYIIEELLQSNAVGDFCLVGPKGCGKSILVAKIAEILGKECESIVLYQDMTSRDLIQQRKTLDNGDTVWNSSPLVNAAIDGKIAILDGIHRIHPSTLSVLHRLVHDREIQLHDGKRLISAQKYDHLKLNKGMTDEQLFQSGILMIHPDFRIVAIGEPAAINVSTNWLSPEVLSLFLYHEIRPLSKNEEMNIITSKCGPISKPLLRIIDLAHILRNSPDATLKNIAGHLSTRQLLRIASRMQKFPTNDIYDIMQDTFMIKFLPLLTRQALETTLKNLGIESLFLAENGEPLKCEVSDNVVTIGTTTVPIYQTEWQSKVPSILFYDVPHHVLLMERLLQDLCLGQHLLLVGNQGVGKNKIADRFLELLNRPREYIQLHRDTTVQTLTVQPTVRDGLLVHEDSPLIKAVRFGHVLVIDEADKAPTHVTCILKTLVETGQMVLSDGRRIVNALPPHMPTNNGKYIISHPDFRIIVLANRPGFPFLGNDFFGALGDLFSCHSVDNPPRRAEIDMLRQYGPDVPLDVIRKLVSVFGELRVMADEGLVNYPYSTREVVNIVKHLQKFPNADLEDVLFNVFDFDKYSPDVVETLGEVLHKHGFPSTNVFTQEYITAKRAKEHLQVTHDRISGLGNTDPKHGKVDPKNEPHVGGNTWAGGTGGRDTAGLGGKGGPYRLYAGHDVHQLSEVEKAEVPEHIRKAAREMGRKAFQEKLKEIGMSGYDANLYEQFSGAVGKQVQSLRVILSTLQAKNKERHWSRHQTAGELDDIKLIDGILGEKTIFRRRAEQDPELGTPQTKPKILRLVVDVSGSMYRFNSYDGRLDRELEAVVLMMESLEGFQDKIQYDIYGHSGETDKIEFVKRKNPPKNNKERLDIIRVMHAHSQYCWSGDNTLEATEHAITTLAEEDSDESIVVVLSDANLQRYGISPSKLTNTLMAHEKVSAYVIFIAGLGDQAERIMKSLPAGRGFVCTDLGKLPQILKQIFSASVLMSHL